MQKDSLFRNWCWENWINACRAMQLSPYRTSLRKIDLKWIRDLNMRPNLAPTKKKKKNRDEAPSYWDW